MSFIIIKNKNGTAGRTPPTGYDSWLEFWEKQKGKKANRCEAFLCLGNAEVGGMLLSRVRVVKNTYFRCVRITTTNPIPKP